MLVTKEFTFDSAHFLPDYHGKCETMHGHTYKMHVTVKGDIQPNGMVIDFAELKKIVQNKIINKLDHQLINEIIEIPSAENIAIWAWEQLEKDLKLYEIKVWETATSFVTYHK